MASAERSETALSDCRLLRSCSRVMRWHRNPSYVGSRIVPIWRVPSPWHVSPFSRRTGRNCVSVITQDTVPSRSSPEDYPCRLGSAGPQPTRRPQGRDASQLAGRHARGDGQATFRVMMLSTRSAGALAADAFSRRSAGQISCSPGPEWRAYAWPNTVADIIRRNRAMSATE